nr:trimethylamine methyltransferase family protein [Chloroflexota bacterium]
HTMRHYNTAFYQHKVFSMDNYEKWEAEGKIDPVVRANGIWKQMLKDYQQPHLDEAIAEELNAFVAQRRKELAERRPRTEWKR